MSLYRNSGIKNVTKDVTKTVINCGDLSPAVFWSDMDE